MGLVVGDAMKHDLGALLWMPRRVPEMNWAPLTTTIDGHPSRGRQVRHSANGAIRVRNFRRRASKLTAGCPSGCAFTSSTLSSSGKTNRDFEKKKCSRAPEDWMDASGCTGALWGLGSVHPHRRVTSRVSRFLRCG